MADKALEVTIVFIALWFVVFPAFVTGLIVFAIVQTRGEKRRYELRRRRQAPGAPEPD